MPVGSDRFNGFKSWMRVLSRSEKKLKNVVRLVMKETQKNEAMREK